MYSRYVFTIITMVNYCNTCCNKCCNNKVPPMRRKRQVAAWRLVLYPAFAVERPTTPHHGKARPQGGTTHSRTSEMGRVKICSFWILTPTSATPPWLVLTIFAFQKPSGNSVLRTAGGNSGNTAAGTRTAIPGFSFRHGTSDPGSRSPVIEPRWLGPGPRLSTSASFRLLEGVDFPLTWRSCWV